MAWGDGMGRWRGSVSPAPAVSSRGFPPPSARCLPALHPTAPRSTRSRRSCAAPAMAAGGSRWRSYLGVIVSRQGQRVQQFQQAEDILLTLLEHVHGAEPRFLVDYCRNLEAFEFTLRASEDAVTVEVPLRLDGDALRVRPCQPGDPGTCHLEVPSAVTGVEDWTSAGEIERGGGTVRHLAPGKVLQHLKELLVSAIVHCQRRFLLQPGDLSAENLKEDAMELSLSVRGGWKTVRFDIVPVVRRQQEPLRLEGRQRDRGFPEGSLQKAMAEAHFIPASPHCWRSSAHLPVLKLLWAVDTLQGPRLDSLRLLEQLSSQDWREEDGRAGLSFDHLKMVLLWSTELFPSPEDWQDLEGSVYRLLVVLLRCLATRRLPHFLRPEENLFHGEPLDLASLYPKVEAFAQDPPRFLRFHFGLPASAKGLQADPEVGALLRLPAEDGAYWDTAYFDILLSQLQVYRIEDDARRSAMSQLLAKVQREIPTRS
ncbi:LOW QUALITY PROTEIN: protein mab-21-like 4 [Anser cygnoides]|uniref:LOW QUALITY PROTEIN: protein mab-21-like 4 n=1 Tax=Anser cygnoides TaxID=8845 RepID=UPI0034D1AFAB